MSEITGRLRKMLSQAQTFARDTPMEAASRARLAVATASAALAEAEGTERAEIENLLAIAQSRAESFAAQVLTWQGEVRERKDLYDGHERQRLAEPLPPKV